MPRLAPYKDDALVVVTGAWMNNVVSFLASLGKAELKFASGTDGPAVITTMDFSKVEIHTPSKTERVDLMKFDLVSGVTICDPVTGATRKVNLVIQRD